MFNLKDIPTKLDKPSVMNFVCVSIIFFTIFFTIFFSFPLLVILPSGTFSFQSLICIFSIESISALSITLLLLKKDILAYLFKFYPLPAIALAVVFGIELVHFIQIDNYTLRDFFFSITLFVIPLAIFAYGTAVKSIIAYYLSLFWIINIIHCFEQIIGNANCTGIAGNRNWNASLIIATAPFVIYLIYKWVSGKNVGLRINLFISSIPGLISLYFIYLCDSRGAWLSLIVVFLIVCIVYLPCHKYRMLLRFGIYSILLLTLLVLFEGHPLAYYISTDIRFSLWHSTLRLFMDNPLFGVSCPSFESAYASYRPIDYFLKSHYFAFRTTHPHNELLYILACFGIFGAGSWIILWVYPLVKLFGIFKKLDAIIKISLLSLSILVIHSMFDLILFQWPTIFIACILLGLLWQQCWPIPQRHTQNTTILLNQGHGGQIKNSSELCDLQIEEGNNKTKISIVEIFKLAMLPFILAVSLSFSVFILFSYQDFRYSSNLRNSEIAFSYYKDPAKSLAYLNDSVNCIPVPSSISHCGLVSSDIFKDNIMALHYFDKLLNTSCPQIAHSNRHIAEALLKSSRKTEALAFLRKDSRNFPISIVTLYMEMTLENELGQKKEAEITAEKLFNALRHMGLTEKHIPLILENPYFENRFVELRNMGK